MAFSLNRAQVIGNLTRDPEIRSTPSGQTVANFSVATNFSWTDQGGQKQEKVEFHNIVAWRRLADICGQYLKKGMKVYVEGRLQTREWEGQDGVKRYRTEIVAENMIMLSRSGEPMGGASVAGGGYERSQRGISSSGSAAGSDGGFSEASTSDTFAGDDSAGAYRPIATTKKGAAGSGDDDQSPVDDLPF